MSRPVSLVCAALITVGMGRGARAQQTEDAWEYVRVAQMRVEQGDHVGAAAAYEQAYERWPSPMLLVQAADQLWEAGDKDGASGHYRRYLEEHPNGRLGDRARARLSAVGSEPPTSAAPNRTPVDSRGGGPWARRFAWGFAGAGAVLLGVGVYSGVRARAARDDLDAVEQFTPRNLQLLDDIDRFDRLTAVSVVGGVLLAGTSAALFWVSRSPETKLVVPVVTGSGAGVGFGIAGRF